MGLAVAGALLVGGWIAKGRADIAALDSTLAAAGCGREHGAPAQACFADRARAGTTPAEAARRLPAPAEVQRFIVPVGDGPDSNLLERYVYRRGLGRWPIYIYYRRGGGVADVYAWDPPGLSGARPVSQQEADQWIGTLR